MASIQARHSRSCAVGKPWTPLAGGDGCTCQPTLYVVVREGSKLHRERVGKNRRGAERALTKVLSQVDEGEYRPQANIRFDTWANQWLGSLERKQTTIDSYRSTVGYAKDAFGHKVVRRLTGADIAAFNVKLRDAEKGDPERPWKMSASTRAKHLRVLGACLQSAMRHGYAARNPVRELPPNEKPRPQRKESADFEHDELPPLFEKVSHGLYRVLFLVALKTGMRLGELAALRWGDVDLTEAVIRVRRSYTDGHLSVPKNHEQRDVDLTNDVVELLGEWWGASNSPTDDALVFPGEVGDYLTPSVVLRRELYPAIERAAIPRVGPTGEKRTFHSFRHTFAKRALESGRQVTWLSRHLGHSSLKVTTDTYGHWERATRKAEAEQMEGVFGV